MAVWRGTRAELSEKLAEVLSAIVGRGQDVSGVGQGFSTAIGVAALGDIVEAYKVKARGGEDAMGIRWPPLSPETIARRRVSRQTLQQYPRIAERERIRQRAYKQRLRELSAGMPIEQAKREAKWYAGVTATRLTGEKRVDVLGDRDVEILIDTGVMLNSLTVGVWDGDQGYSPPSKEGGENQIFDAVPGMVTLGTRDRKFNTHNYGSASRNIPRRQVFPDDASEIPDSWWGNWRFAAMGYLTRKLEEIFG